MVRATVREGKRCFSEFQTTPAAHAPAVVVGLLPGVGAWGVMMAKSGRPASAARAARRFSAALVPAFHASDTWIDGGFALDQGFIFTAMVLAATTVAIIEKRFAEAAAWCGTAAGLAAVGLVHSYRFTPGDVVFALEPAWPWAAGCAIMAGVLLAARWLTEPDAGH